MELFSDKHNKHHELERIVKTLLLVSNSIFRGVVLGVCFLSDPYNQPLC